MKVYKGTDKDMKCRGFQYELGVTVKSDDAIRCGNKGFHSCEAPFDVLRYYENKNGNRFFEATADGKIDRTGADDSKIASSEITLDTEISFANLVSAQIKYTRTKAESGKKGGGRSNISGGDNSNIAGGNWINIAGGNRSNIAGGYWSNVAVGDCSNAAGDYCSNLAGGDGSNVAGGNRSNIAGGNRSNIVGGYWSNVAVGDCSNAAGDYCSNLAGGDRNNVAGGNRSNVAVGDNSNVAVGDCSNVSVGDGSNVAGGNRSNLLGGEGSNLAGGNRSLVVGRNYCSAKAGMNSVIVLTEWKRTYGKYTPVSVKAEIVDGKRIKADTWYKLVNGEFTEVE